VREISWRSISATAAADDCRRGLVGAGSVAASRSAFRTGVRKTGIRDKTGIRETGIRDLTM
jgi:hypothetical protein